MGIFSFFCKKIVNHSFFLTFFRAYLSKRFNCSRKMNTYKKMTTPDYFCPDCGTDARDSKRLQLAFQAIIKSGDHRMSCSEWVLLMIDGEF